MGFKSIRGLIRNALSRAFRTGLRPTALGNGVGRLLEKERTTDIRGHTIVPNYLIFALSEKDRARFTQVEETLRRQLIETAQGYARSNAYGFSGPLSIDFATNPRFRTGRFELSGEFREAPIGDSAVLVTSDGVRVEITTPQILGRNDDCGVVLGGSNVSRHHAEIRADQHGLFIVDLGSTNGTLVAGVAIATHRLLHGDIVTIGDHHLRVEAV
ncbi:MAG: FhaA domain-containing protein [Actinomycetota bacterium]|nr:FhaA domain-containing protein [Actinomycetota bacterium]